MNLFIESTGIVWYVYNVVITNTIMIWDRVILSYKEGLCGDAVLQHE